MQPHEEIPYTVNPHPYCASSTNEERLPPPVVVFGTELHVDCHDSYFGNRDDEYDGDDGEEAKDIVIA